MTMLDARLAPLLEDGVIDDPWARGAPRLSADAEILSQAQASSLAHAACAVALMIDEAVPAVASDPLLAHQLGLDDSLMAIAALDAPRWLALARADVFLLADGSAQVCEINCDTPTGLAECTQLARVAAAASPHLLDPSARLRERWIDMVRSCVGGTAAGVAGKVVGIVDPTEMPEDLCHVRLLTRWLEDAGFTVVRGSPFNLHACPDHRVGLFGTPCDVLLRQYKTDWWAKRSSPWRDEAPPPHADRLERELALIADAMQAGTLAVLNPWGAAIAQNKRTLALPFERPELFSAEVLAAVRPHLQETRFLESLSSARLIAEREQWVLKSAYGCEGDEVLLGTLTAPAAWAHAVQRADPRHWIAQRAFTPRRDADGRIANHGVFLIGGTPSAIYTRRSTGPTDSAAQSCPTLVRPTQVRPTQVRPTPVRPTQVRP